MEIVKAPGKVKYVIRLDKSEMDENFHIFFSDKLKLLVGNLFNFISEYISPLSVSAVAAADALPALTDSLFKQLIADLANLGNSIEDIESIQDNLYDAISAYLFCLTDILSKYGILDEENESNKLKAVFSNYEDKAVYAYLVEY